MSKPKGIVDWLVEDSPMAKARESERAATEAEIVAWLRVTAQRIHEAYHDEDEEATVQACTYEDAADAIERGEYRR